MGFRIDKIWGQYLQLKGSSRKSRQDSEQAYHEQDGLPHGHEHSHQQPQDQNQPPKDANQVTLAELQKAVDEASAAFELQGVALQAVLTPEGAAVRFFAASGQLIRQVTGAEFLQLKVSSHLDKISRGKVLDQKF